MSEVYHIPAMLAECIEALDIRPGGKYVDATFGGGGHSRAILQHLDSDGHLYSFDRDADAMANAGEFADDSRFTFIHGNFRFLSNFLRYYNAGKVDGILADLGVSFHHFDDVSRGFSFRADAPLDMRMNRLAGITAAQVIDSYTPERLAEIFRIYGDIKRPGRLVTAITAARAKEPIATTTQLLNVVRPLVNPKQEKKELAQIFQALRMEVNGETDALRHFLHATTKVLKPGGRLVVLTYHSIEDRMVKNFLKTGNLEGRIEKDFFGKNLTPWRDVSRGAIAPTQEEVERNPRARSAKLRIAELIETNDNDDN